LVDRVKIVQITWMKRLRSFQRPLNILVDKKSSFQSPFNSLVDRVKIIQIAKAEKFPETLRHLC
jgi:hypothetical protein